MDLYKEIDNVRLEQIKKYYLIDHFYLYHHDPLIEQMREKRTS